MMRRIHVVLPLALALGPAFVWAESATPSMGYTGASAAGIDHGGQDCSTCHSTYGPANSDPSGSLTVTVGDYNPGIQQVIKILIKHPQADRWGFQAAIREVSDETLSVGTFSPALVSDPVQVLCDDGSRFGSAASCSTSPRQFAEHKAAPGGSAGSPYEFDILWNPPSQEVGKLDVYIAVVAANGDGTPAGDRVYTFHKTISNIGACSVGSKPTLQTVLNGGSFQSPFSSNAMVSIFGLGFQASGYKRTAGFGDFVNGGFPTKLGCVSVQVTGPGIPQPLLIPISYVQQDQINAQMPRFTGTGPVTIQVIENPGGPNQLMSDLGTLNAMQQVAPAFFLFSGSTSIATLLAGSGQIIADPALVPGARAARPGELVSLFATGFGDTKTPVDPGQLASGPDSLTNPVIVTIGTTTLSTSQIQYAGLTPGSISGLYQFNVQVPPGTPNGAIPVSISINGVTTQTGATIPVQQ